MKRKTTRPSKQCKFCIYLDNLFDQSGFQRLSIGPGGPGGPGFPGWSGWSRWSGWSGWSGWSEGQGGPDASCGPYGPGDQARQGGLGGQVDRWTGGKSCQGGQGVQVVR